MTQSSSATLSSTHPKTGKVLMVASGKGGVGKTWFSITLSQSLALLGQKVLLFDGDLGMANIDIQLGLQPDKDLGTFLSGQTSLQDSLTTYREGFDVLTGRSGCGSLAYLSMEKLWSLLQSLKTLASNYDFLILDVGAGIGDSVKSMARVSDACLVVVTDEPTSLTDAYALIKVLHGAFPELLKKVVVNQAETTEAGQGVFETLKRVAENFLSYGPDLCGIIRRDTRVKEAIRHQSPLLTRHQSAVAAKDVQKIATSLLEGFKK